ncbi:MAG: hypothetical protein FWD49_05360 [Firmicutes bacterium]|nr:hypothetical protein [Bacillota bacterium]
MIFKVIAFALIGVFTVVILKQVKPELALFAGVVTGILIIVAVLGELTGILETFQNLTGGSVNNGLFDAIMKIIGIGYLTEYAASLCEDYGSASIGKNVQLGGKVTIFALAVPIILTIIEAVGALTT